MVLNGEGKELEVESIMSGALRKYNNEDNVFVFVMLVDTWKMF